MAENNKPQTTENTENIIPSTKGRKVIANITNLKEGVIFSATAKESGNEYYAMELVFIAPNGNEDKVFKLLDKKDVFFLTAKL